MVQLNKAKKITQKTMNKQYCKLHSFTGSEYESDTCPDCALERDAADQDKRDVRADLEAGWLDSISR